MRAGHSRSAARLMAAGTTRRAFVGSALAEHEPGAERVGGIKNEPVLPRSVRHALDLGDHGGAVSVAESLHRASAKAGPDDGLVQEFVADAEPFVGHQFRNPGARA